ncbi:MAG: E3 binding domain-containing protein, partial [Acidobacteria bacterium]|nr:E3 binding domain-containing protein [Acidobacteriota bacterium]
MTTKVIMPQMGESIAEGTITKWFKKVGDSVERDEPLFEISTDKVDAEIPAPAAGILLEIFAEEGETVEVNTEVATIGAAGEKPATGAAGSATPAPIKAKEKSAPAATAPPAAPAATGASSRAEAGKDELRRTRSSPVVRRMASEHDIDISQVTGTGISGRVTRKDMEAFIAGGGAAAAPSAAAPGGVAAPAAPAFGPSPVAVGSARDLREPMSVLRKSIAHHMVRA